MSMLPSADGLQPLDASRPYSPENYEFLRQAVADRTIVQLGESLRMTQEFARVRLDLLRYLHEELGFDVVAFEGSLVAAWLAQERLLRLEAPMHLAGLEEVQRRAFIRPWQTVPMLQVLQYIASTQGTAHPLYAASFDMQLGTSDAFEQGAWRELQALFEALEAYQVRPSRDQLARWQEHLDPWLDCSGPPPSDVALQTVYACIAEIEGLVQGALPGVAAQRGSVHAKVLAQVGAALRARSCDCSKTSANDLYSAERSAGRAATNAHSLLRLREEIAPGRKIIAWGHQAYLSHGSATPRAPSMGHFLYASAPETLYTIGLFAGGGVAWERTELGLELLRLAPLGNYGIERLLQALASTDYFYALNQKEPEPRMQALFNARLASRRGPRWEQETVLADDYHAVIFVNEVHAPRLVGIAADESCLMCWWRKVHMLLAPSNMPKPWIGPADW